MADKHATIMITGEVQKVGYRDFVQKIARKLDVLGNVENMRDGSVQVVCEAEEPVIEEFQKAINVKVDFIDVDEVKVVETAEPTGEFEYFDIKYGSAEEELGERMGTRILYMAATRDEVKSMHTDMNTRFDTLDEDYGEFGKDVKALRNDIGELKSLASEFGEFKDLFAMYIKHEMSKD